jgi:hypothetical protein
VHLHDNPLGLGVDVPGAGDDCARVKAAPGSLSNFLPTFTANSALQLEWGL